jgi:hypothetical protein
MNLFISPPFSFACSVLSPPLQIAINCDSTRLAVISNQAVLALAEIGGKAADVGGFQGDAG